MTPMNPHAFFDALSPSTMKFGLDRMRAADAALGHPWKAYKTLHVAGTNGKGSTCAFAESMLRAAGLRVGLYTSPHLEALNERFRVDGVDASDAELVAGIEEVCLAYQPARTPGHEDALTYFEFQTALAYAHFRRAKVDVAIIEVGLGGRHDATNVLTPAVCAIATIAFDHQEFLGHTLALIAGEKAGILKSGVPAAVLAQDPEARAVIRAVAAEVGAPALFHGEDFGLEGERLRLGARVVDGVQLGLAGAHQQGNAALAAAAALAVHPLTDAQVRQGLAAARWAGRLELWHGVLLDGAHNPEGARSLAAHLDTLKRPVHLVYGVLGDKDYRGMVDLLSARAGSLSLVPPSSPRALAPEKLLPLVATHADARAFGSVSAGLWAAQDKAARDGGLVVVAGSLYLVGEARRLLRPR